MNRVHEYSVASHDILGKLKTLSRSYIRNWNFSNISIYKIHNCSLIYTNEYCTNDIIAT